MITTDFRDPARMRTWLTDCPRRTLLMRFYSIENKGREPYPLHRTALLAFDVSGGSADRRIFKIIS